MTAPRKPKMPAIRCPYCAEVDNFKVMMGHGGPEPCYLCARFGHLDYADQSTLSVHLREVHRVKQS